MRKLILALLAAGLIIVPAQAQTPKIAPSDDPSFSGLLLHCTAKDDVEQAACDLYVGGFVHGVTLAAYASRHGGPLPCLPQQVYGEEYFRVMKKWVQDHPNRLHEDVPRLVYEAFLEAYPCKVKG